MINIYQISGIVSLCLAAAIIYLLNKRRKKQAEENNGKQSKTG